jgi:hypothetical protein
MIVQSTSCKGDGNSPSHTVKEMAWASITSFSRGVVIISHGLENRYANYGSKIVNSLSGM